MITQPRFVRENLNPTNLADVFVKTANDNNEKVAVIFNDQELTFGELKQKSNIVAYNVNKIVKCNKRPIAVYIEKCPEAVIADIGILLSGNFYMNLDVNNPKERIAAILALIQPEIIITNQKSRDKIAGLHEKVIVIEDLLEDDIQISDDDIFEYRKDLIDTDPSCIINTSGSTGTPKGVVLNHRSFFDFTLWAQETFVFDSD